MKVCSARVLEASEQVKNGAKLSLPLKVCFASQLNAGPKLRVFTSSLLLFCEEENFEKTASWLARDLRQGRESQVWPRRDKRAARGDCGRQ